MTFWTIPSLGVHLIQLRKVVASLPAIAQREETEEESEEEDLLAPDTPLASTVNAECTLLFHRAIDALCAWTTGPDYLLRQPFTKSPIVLHLSVVDVPRRPIKALTVNQLLNYWAERCKWAKDAAIRSIVQSFRSRDESAQSGACHCEAGLMAFLVASVNSDEESTQSPSSSVDQRATRPTDTVPIGVAQKCCPICWMLGDALVSEGITVELPGRHNHYHPCSAALASGTHLNEAGR
ncbi:hypothetical protein B0H19DRAFT_231617 [Mycena capillaripes]|nr:hypothetical protein B0H19DRAFT_231617 [Mycena capillaripes]